MTVVLSALWSYAGVSMREDEGGWFDANRARMLREKGFGYVAPLLGDGRTRVNEQHAFAIRANATRQGLAMVGWFTPRNTSGVPVAETVQLAADCKAEYGLDAVRYQCEAEFEYSNPAMGGAPAERFGAMAELGAEHRARLGATPAAVYARVGLNLADGWWAKAWQYGFRCFVECYGPTERPTHPGWAAIAAPGSYAPPLVGGWWYRVRLGTVVRMGRMTDDGRSIVVDGATYRVGTAAGPRRIANPGNAAETKWGAVLGFFPTSWIKPVVPTYVGEAGVRPSGATLAREILTFQASARKFGDASKGWSVYVGPEMTADHFDSISPRVLTGTALLP